MMRVSLNKTVARTLLATTFALLLSGAAFAADVQGSRCLSDGSGDPSRPVDVIYLHGWFAARGADVHGFQGLEAGNRVKLAEMAHRLHLKIAVPVSPEYNRNNHNFRTWSGVSFETIEHLASQACGGAPLANRRSMIGFSDGAYRSHHIAEAAAEACASLKPRDRDACARYQHYSKIFSLGAPHRAWAVHINGTNVIIRTKHEVPEWDYFAHYFESHATPAPAAASPAAPALPQSRHAELGQEPLRLEFLPLVANPQDSPKFRLLPFYDAREARAEGMINAGKAE